MLVDRDGRLADRYDKNWLVPMGEFVVMRPLLQPFDPIFHFPPDTMAGVKDRVMAAGRGRLCVLICYESVFPILSRTRSRLGANLLVGITNDSWAGESAELQQHIAMAAFRAVENRRWLASAATTGITGLIGPTGRIEALPPYREDVMVGTVRLRSEVTLYARFGDWLVALCALLVGAVLFGGLKRHAVEGAP
jgi:apolipoprotein N-acyltransferase